MKRIITAIALAFALTASLTACSGGAKPEPVITADGTAIPATNASIIKLVERRYKECLDPLAYDGKATYVRKSSGDVVPGTITLTTKQGELTFSVGQGKSNILVVPSDVATNDALTTVGC